MGLKILRKKEIYMMRQVKNRNQIGVNNKVKPSFLPLLMPLTCLANGHPSHLPLTAATANGMQHKHFRHSSKYSMRVRLLLPCHCPPPPPTSQHNSCHEGCNTDC